MSSLRRRADRNLWSIPVLVFIILEATITVWSAISPAPVLLAAVPLTARQQVYTSLTGSSSALLGLALAAVAILAAFGPRPAPAGQSRREAQLARARTNLIGALLAASFFLLVLLITATVALAMDARVSGNGAVTSLIESAGTASVVGLILSGLGLTLVIAERSRQ